MGTFKPGAMGAVNGLIDTIVASKWKETYVVKGRPTRSNKPASLTQADQRLRFALVTAFLKRVGDTIAVGYQNPGKNLTPMNVAARYHLANAVTGIYPAYKIDYAKVRLSNTGAVMNGGWGITLAAAAERLVTVKWEANEFPPKGTNETDLLTVVFYNVEKDGFITFEGVAERSQLTFQKAMPSVYVGDTMHCWTFFVSVDGKSVSTSVYMGLVKILA